MHRINLLKFKRHMMCVSDRSSCRLRPDRPAQILKDEKKKAAFDQYGAASQQPGFDPDAFARNPFAGAGGFGSAFGRGGGQSDLFDQLFGAMGGRGHGGTSAFTQNVRG